MRCFLKGCYFTQWKSTEIHWSESNEVLIYIIWECGIFLPCYRKCSYTPNHNTFNQQLTVNYSCQIIYTWPFISLSIKKPQKVQHPKQSTSRAILPLFAVMETCTQNCNYQFDETLAPQTEAPQKPHSMWVYRGESMGHDIKGKRPPLAWPAERWMLHTVWYGASGQTGGSLGFAMYFPVKAEDALQFRSRCYQPFPPSLTPRAVKPA